MVRLAAIAVAAALALSGQLAPDLRAALERITAANLKGHVSFLASDVLEGRGTPSRGLDVAAEYIAAQFRRIGLEPAGDDGYFQTAEYVQATPKIEAFTLTVQAGGTTIRIPPDRVRFEVPAAARIERAAAVRVTSEKDAMPERLRGQVVVAGSREIGRGALRAKVLAAGPAAIIGVTEAPWWRRAAAPRLLSAEDAAGPPAIIAADADLPDAIAAGPVTVTLRIAEPEREEAKLRNVIGLLRGSDAALKYTYVIVSAHYDHLGVKPDGRGDRIDNGANDDASGTASLIETANALAAAKPRRSVLFIAFFGEERGLLGSAYYIEHPAAPLARTVADINLEQTGRTDAENGPQIGRAWVTGFDYSDVGPALARAAAAAGITVAKDPSRSDKYYRASDNYSFAAAGIPAHTICVAFEYPDYHKPSDEWPKLDYDNMARVTRALAAGIAAIAASDHVPAWNVANPKAEPFIKAKKASD